MCGIAGLVATKLKFNESKLISSVTAMAQMISYRGPDSAGEWADSQEGIALAHRRLAIVDLSSAGHQPMHSQSGRYVISYNGEIYNHLELRAILEKSGSDRLWRGHSDTETLLALIDESGLERALQSLVGMFAFALWDKEEHMLTLARDRMGEKPLYYGWHGGNLLFGSEVKALTAHPSFERKINRGVISLFLKHSYIPAPYSIYENTFKLPPASYIQFRLAEGIESTKGAEVHRYWGLEDIARHGTSGTSSVDESSLLDNLHIQLKQAVRQQMVADVPLGAFLSGGVDSSAVVALMQSQSSRPVKTFTIGFDEKIYNEAEHAKAVAGHLGTEHTELYVSPRDALDVIPKLPQIYCEPFADSSQIPTYLVSKLAKQQVTVSLSGDAGDELFGGYNRYRTVPVLWKRLRYLPQSLRRAVSETMTAVSPDGWQRGYDLLEPIIPRRYKVATAGDKAHKFAGILGSTGPIDIYRGLTSIWENPEELVLGAREPTTLLSLGCDNYDQLDLENRMMLLDGLTYLPDDILTKVDRASMAVSLESRVPFLDHRVIEMAWQLPLSMKIRDGQTKWALRQVLYQYVPQHLIERPKMGFSVPIGDWLRGPLRDWAEMLISKERLDREGFLSSAPIRKKWEEHLSGRRDWQHQLWNVLMFQAWLESSCI